MEEKTKKKGKEETEEKNPSDEHCLKVATVAIVGRPSSGKSTFLNAVTNQNVSIVSSFPQTTRNAIRGIVSEKRGQLVFIDTPGIHESQKKLNLRLKDIATRQMKEADCILYIIDCSRGMAQEENEIIDLVVPYRNKSVIAINKIDMKKSILSSFCDIEFFNSKMTDFPKERVIFMSAKTGENIQQVLSCLFSLAPQGSLLYPKEYYTDQTVEFRIKEVIRGEAVKLLQQDLPHAIYVDIQDAFFKESPAYNKGKTCTEKKEKKLFVRAFLCVERESQKGIVIGKKASMIKKIRLLATKELRNIFDYEIVIDLQVKVRKNWRQNDDILNRIFKNC